MKKSLKGILGLSLLGVSLLAACSNTTTSHSTSATTPSTTPSATEQTQVSLRGFELKEYRKTVENNTFNLATVIEFYEVKSVDALSFSSSNEEIATVDSKGVITRKQYGSSTITIAPTAYKDNIFMQATFQIFFAPPESYLLGKYDSHIDGVEGQPEVLVTIEIKANKHFTITYTAGKVAANDEQYDVAAQTLDGTYEDGSVLKFTITSETTLKKTFSGMFVFDGDKVTIKAKVPVSPDKTSRIIYLEGLN